MSEDQGNLTVPYAWVFTFVVIAVSFTLGYVANDFAFTVAMLCQ